MYAQTPASHHRLDHGRVWLRGCRDQRMDVAGLGRRFEPDDVFGRCDDVRHGNKRKHFNHERGHVDSRLYDLDNVLRSIMHARHGLRAGDDWELLRRPELLMRNRHD